MNLFEEGGYDMNRIMAPLCCNFFKVISLFK